MSDNREILLRCALDLFSARGYDAVGVQEIVAAAGVTKPTLYHYFGSKRGMLEVVLDTHFLPFERRLAGATTYTGDLTLSLRRVAEAFFRLAQSTPAFYRLHVALYLSPPESEPRQIVSPFYARQHLLLATLFELATADHGNMRGRHARYALTWRGMVDSYVMAMLDGYLAYSEGMIFDLVHQFSHGIYS
ncbi:MAG: TetR/AcrR family transcriptional regulator [Anaerolineae bacterium]|nr:TetR/AcrR family transcriptional regulator [Anaerolineae bacterium]